MSRYLFSISIGPVQEFIAAARKTRDLWFGSEILSEISKAVARAAREHTADLIFPAPEDPEQLERGSALSVANKLLFLAVTDDPAALTVHLRSAVRACLNEHADHALTIAAGDRLEIDDEAFRKQLANFSEFYAAWVICPDDGAYQRSRKQAEKLLAARKGLRNFAQHAGSPAAKNTIDGVRESVLVPASIGHSRGHQVKPSERLDAIGLLKRFGRKGVPPAFDSTHDLAAIPYVRALLRLRPADPAIRECLEEYQRIAAILAPDSSPFMTGLGKVLPGRLLGPDSEDDLKGKDAPRDPVRREAIQQADVLRNRLQWHVRERHKIKPPGPYYAVLLADGDHMGKALDACTTKEEHSSLSRHLSRFASEARKALEIEQTALFSGLASVVYAGGDDLLAFVPLDTALEAASTARGAFLAALEPIRQKLAASGQNDLPTLSAGLVIAHAQEDLTSVIEQAHRTLDYAKHECNRDALAITLMRRSGAPFTTGAQWDDALGLFDRLLAAYRQNRVPFGLGYDWRLTADRCRRMWPTVDPRLPHEQKEQIEKPFQDLPAKWALAVLEQKSESSGDELEQVVRQRVTDPASLERLANQLVLAKALHDGGAMPAQLPREAHA